MKVKRVCFAYLCIFAMLISIVFPSGVGVKAKELGKGGDNSFIEDVNIKFSLKNFPRIWTGNYDGAHGTTHVNRKYALKINSIDENSGEFVGVGYVDKGTEKPDFQHKAIFNVSGIIDIEKRSIVWERGSAIDNPGGLTWVRFEAVYSKNLKKITGSTSAWNGARVELKNANHSEIESTIGVDLINFDYDESTVNYDLANECMELSALIYSECCDDGTGFYKEAKNTSESKQALANKLIHEKFSSKDYVYACDNQTHNSVVTMNLQNSPSKNNGKDCIHWISAEKELADGTELVYVVVKGTTGNEWYGNFNVSSSEEEGNYNENNNEKGIHYSFEHAAEGLFEDLNTRYKDLNKKIKYVITGHSRGAAVANILAKKLTDYKKDDSRIKSVYGYTFATPTTIVKSKSNQDYNNIYNFCFDDDFVTYLPLADADWQYGRYGTTYYTSATKLYKDYSLFRAVSKNYFHDNSASSLGVSYKEKGAYDIAQALTSSCKNVEEFYKEDKPTFSEVYTEFSDVPVTIAIDSSWYEFFHGTFASLLSGNMKNADFYAALHNKQFRNILMKFVVGATGFVTESYSLAAYVGNTHSFGSYYALTQLLKYNSSAEKDLVDDISKSTLRHELAQVYPSSKQIDVQSFKMSAYLKGASEDSYNEDQVSALKEFANTDDNLSLLGWTLDDPSTWDEVEWNTNGDVISINIDSLGVCGKLDLSSFSAIDYLDCTNNKLTDLILPDKENIDVYCDGNYLSVNPKNDLYKKLIKYSENGSIVSFSDQCVPDNAKFNTTELKKLKEFANTDNNLALLGWDIDNPQSYVGVKWILINGTYYVDSIELSYMQLSGTFDFSKFGYVKSVDLSNNTITNINASGCGSLEILNVCNNKLTDLNISNVSKLSTLYCSDNYLVDNLNDDILSLRAQDKDTVVEVYPQYSNSSAEKYSQEELKTLKEFMGSVVQDVDWSHPGMNSCFQWKKVDEKYYLQYLDLSGTEVSGNIDLSGFKYLTKVNFFRTDISGITLPSSTTESDDYAFAYCPNLENVCVTDSWTSMGTDVFYESPNVTLTCTRNTFAEFIADALNIPFNEIVALAYLEVDGKPDGYYLQGEEFDLKGAELKVYYSDGTTKNITDGYEIDGYDASKLGKQTVTLRYTEDNYTKSTALDIVVYGHTDNGLLYLFTDKNENKIQITGYVGDSDNVTIPAKINDIQVIKVADSAFEDNNTITSVAVSESITEIGSHVFKNCKNLNNISLPESLKTLGTYSFEECDAVETIEIPSSITKITEGAFYNCDKLTNVITKGELQNIDKYAFKDCISIKEFDFGNNLKEIGERAFSGCGSLESAMMPDSITGLGTYIFENCTSLKKVHINEGRVNIMEGMFDGCRNLEEVNIPSSVENIRELAFRHCEKLTEIELPSSVKLIEYGAFSHCYSLQKIGFSAVLSEIGDYAFYNCTSLEEANMPDSITSLGESIFANCTSLKKVHINEGRKNITYGIFENCSSLQEINIPDSVENIRAKAFSGCTSLTKLTLPAGLKLIEANAFDGASINNIEFKGSEEQLKLVDIQNNGNDVVMNSNISTIADGKTVVLAEDKKDDTQSNPTKTITPQASNENNATNNNQSDEDSSTYAKPSKTNSDSKKKSINHVTKINIRNKKIYKKSKKIKVSDKDGIKLIKINKKRIKVKGKKSFSFKLKKYKKFLKGKKKWNKIIITDMNNKKTTIKFKVK